MLKGAKVWREGAVPKSRLNVRKNHGKKFDYRKLWHLCIFIGSITGIFEERESQIQKASGSFAKK